MNRPVQVLVVDDQPRARQSLRALLMTWPLIGGIREAADGQVALDCIEQAQPDLVLMDVRMPVLDGLEATQQIKLRWPRVKIIALSLYSDYQAEALGAGADLFVSKGEAPETLLSLIERVSVQ